MNLKMVMAVFSVRKIMVALLLLSITACGDFLPQESGSASDSPPGLPLTTDPTGTVVEITTEAPLSTPTDEDQNMESALTPTLDSTTISTGVMTPQMQVVADFLEALQDGLTAADSSQYLAPDLQAAVEDGRPLPTIVGIRDAFPGYELTDLTDNNFISGAVIRATFHFDVPTYAIFRLVSEDNEWRIRNIFQHNLVRSAITRDMLMAEIVIINYYQALANNKIDDALAYLTGEAQEIYTAEALSPIATGLEQVTVTTLQPVRAGNDQITVYVRLFAAADSEQPGPWRDGDNARWLTLVRSEDGWQITRIINSPILAEVKAWQRVDVLPINMTLDIPSDWTRPNLEWAWSPNSLGLPGIGVSWVELGEFDSDERLLPRRRQAISQEPISLGWAEGTQYTFEQMGGPGEGPISAETHIIVYSERRAYDFYAIANSGEELAALRPILQRMVAAVVIYDPEAKAYNALETTTSFLATLIRDKSGQSSVPFLSEALLVNGETQQALLNLLALEGGFQSFEAAWVGIDARGQATVKATLYFADDKTDERMFTLARNDEQRWQIIKIDKADE